MLLNARRCGFSRVLWGSYASVLVGVVSLLASPSEMASDLESLSRSESALYEFVEPLVRSDRVGASAVTEALVV